MEASGHREAGQSIRRQGSRTRRHPGCGSDEAARQDRTTCRRAGFFGESLRSLSLDRRRTMIDPGHPRLSIVRQCELAAISRATFYRRPAGESAETLAPHATYRRDVFGMPVLRRTPDGSPSSPPWMGGRTQARSPADAQDRPFADLSGARRRASRILRTRRIPICCGSSSLNGPTTSGAPT